MKLKLPTGKLFLLLLLSTFSFFGTRAQSGDPKYNVMMQGFWWNSYQDPTVTSEGGLYNFLKARTRQLSEAGVDVVWTPPPSDGAGMAYFPQQLFVYSNAHGSEAQLRAMLTEFKSKGMHGMADVVANHRNGTTAWADFTNPTWGCEAIVENDEVKGVAGQVQPCSGQNDEGEGFDGVRDMNHKSATVLNGYKQYLTNLKGLGFDSWRWDFTKGFPAKYVAEYNASSAPYFSVGEYFDANVGLLTGWVDASGNRSTGGTTTKSATFDFATYYILSRAVTGSWSELNSGGHMPGLAGTFGYSNYAVTFAENHDTHNISGNDNIMKANAYILTHPGIPMVYIKHWLANKQKINELIAVRKQNGINAWSGITIDQSSSFYAAYINDASNNHIVAVKIGPGSWSPAGTGWILNTSGNDYAVWSKKNITTPTVIPEPYLSISIVGPAVGGWSNDVQMRTDDGVTYKLYSQTCTAGSAKFRSGNSWATNWGDSSFPSGVGTQDGKDIPVKAGTYNITFNAQTGAFSFGSPTTAPPNNFAKRYLYGTPTNNQFVPLTTTDGYNYSLTNYQFGAGTLKIRDTTVGGNQWGDSSFPTGNAVYTTRSIPVKAGTYSVKYNKVSGYYEFFTFDTSISIIGTAVADWNTDKALKSFDQVNYTLDVTLLTGEAKFRKDRGWSVNWGSNTFPSGTGTQDGPNIPVTAGTYRISFNKNSGAYNFKSVLPAITSFTPATQTTGGSVTIKGQNFSGATAVSFGNIAAASYNVVNDSTISAVIGNGATGSVKVTTSLGSATKAGFTFQCAPVSITSVTAAANPLCYNQKTSVTANGVNGTSPVVTWWTAAGGTGTNLGTGTTLANRGPGTYYARVTGSCGSPVEKSVRVWGDTVKPVITCPANLAVKVAGCSKTITLDSLQFSDNCKVSTVTWKLTGATTGNSASTGINILTSKAFKLGNTTVAYTVKDSSGNSIVCSFTVNVKDTVKPTFVAFVSKYNDTTYTGCNKMVKFPVVNTKDNCGTPTLSWVMSGSNVGTGTGKIDSMLLKVGTTTVKYTLKDSSGNTNTGTLTIVLVERVAPVITCPRDTSRTVAACSTSVATKAPVYSDNCNISKLTWALSGATVATGSNNVGTKTFNSGITTVKYTLKDSSGNTSTCSYKVTINSTTTCFTGRFVTPVEEKPMEFSVTLSPNPAFAAFGLNIKSPATDAAVINVYNSAGKKVEQVITSPNKRTMIGANYKGGSYLFEVIQGDQRTTTIGIKR